jgi:DNA-binding transcriptional regulator YdaS (Cro superfamily)
MKPHDIFQHFGSQGEAARALQVSRQVVWQWQERGKVPMGWQQAIEVMTKGALKRDRPRAKAAE